jgi:uncharacterized protein (TIGR03083 family)
MDLKPAGTEPILCAALLRGVDAKLLELLASLTPEEWDLPTVAGSWRVRDVAAHLLDTPLRKLSLVRDQCFVEKVELRSPHDIVGFVNRLNREGVVVYRRLSPQVLIDMMQIACEASASFHESLDPFAPAVFNVSWAGEERSLNWFDTARELTERWHHQQQVRLAAHRPGIQTPDLYHPVLDCFLRGLPFLFRDVSTAEETTIAVEIAGDCGGRWAIQKHQGAWIFVVPGDHPPAARVTIPQEIAWRVFTKGIDRDTVLAQTTIEGDRGLGERVLRLTSIVG